MKQRQIHAKDNTMDGFRVQIFMELGNYALEHAEKVKGEFTEKYPDVPVYLVFGQPYYRVRVGDFRTRLEAEHLYQQIKKEYSNAFVTADRIELPYIALCSGTADLENLMYDSLDILNDDFEYLIDSLYLDDFDWNDTIDDFDERIFYDD